MAKRYIFNSNRDFYGWLAMGFVMLFLSWGIFIYYSPIITETNCSEIASKSSSILTSENSKYYPSTDYDNIKAKCMEESFANKNLLSGR
jgi:hypothetical protein